MYLNILVTGGAGYIGSLFVKEALKNNYRVVVLDNLSRGHVEALPENITLLNENLSNSKILKEKFLKLNISCIVHFAGYALVGESIEDPELYYDNNIVGTLSLLNTALDCNIKKFIFSSSCSVYGNPNLTPITEEETIKPINPYAETKAIVEKILMDYEKAYNIKFVSLRYFNAAGADFSGNLGESHNPETHLIPRVIKTALGELNFIEVFGTDYPTEDGTCVRDYIHIEDLATAHIKAIDYLQENDDSLVVNLGTGKGNSVKQIIEITSQIIGKDIPVKYSERRPGDPAILVADNTKARQKLKWQAKYNLNDIIESAYNWHKNQKY
ncbi:MAG: UDP-glucose 4-epimerase GalE [Ignavibacteriales bacterium]|nr:UDP-glucose 4-epimerase GalE [Ignavibacteriales bacterium]